MHSVFLLAAGFGTRLRPLTNHRPKPLLPIMGRPMLDYALAHLRSAGHDSFIVNAHHLWELVAEWAHQNGCEVQVELPEILGTGGGLKAAESKMTDRFLIWNGDILSNIDPKALLDSCPEEGASMALCYKEQLGKTTQLLFDDSNIVSRIGSLTASSDAKAMPTGPSGWHFSGIHALSKKALANVPEGFQCIIRSAYIDLVQEKKVSAHAHKGYWVDTGTPEEYLRANLDALNGVFELSIDVWSDSKTNDSKSWIDRSASVKGSIHNSIIGAHATVPQGTRLDSCVVWDGVEVPQGDFKYCIFHDGGMLQIELG